MAFENRATFDLSVIGDVTQETYLGTFKFKLFLSGGDVIQRDARYRELLGAANPQFAANDASEAAWRSADMLVRVLEAPPFWVDSNQGLKLEDTNVPMAIYAKIMELFKKAEADKIERAKRASEELKKAVTQG